MSRRIKTTETSFEILDLLMELDGATMPDLSERLNLANSTVHGHLKTLESNGLVVKEGNEYYLGLRFFQYGNYTRQRKPEYQFADKHVTRLADETREAANFCVAEHGQSIVLFGDSTPEDPAYGVGTVFHMHETAVGKVMLAEMSEDRVREIIDEWGLPRRTENTITDEEALFDELDDVRRRGYAYNHEELMTGLSAVGVAVKRPDSSVLGALSVGGPTYRIDGQKLEGELTDVILDTKNAFEEDIRSLYATP